MAEDPNKPADEAPKTDADMSSLNPKVANFRITVNMANGKISVAGPIHLKALAIKAFAEAMIIVTDYIPPPMPGQARVIPMPGHNGAAPHASQ